MKNRSFQQSSELCKCQSSHVNHTIQPDELLEKYWFYGNLLDCRKTMRIVRSFSDPCSSSLPNQENFPGKSYEETFESIEKLSVQSNEVSRPKLTRAPTTPASFFEKKRKTKKKSRLNNLARAPSLPTRLLGDYHELDDEDDEFSLGKLIRTASLNDSDSLSPKIKSPSISRQKSRLKTEMDNIVLANQLETKKSFEDLEYEELQGFKDMGFDFNKKELNQNVVSMIPGLQDKKVTEEDEETNKLTMVMRRRPYLSESWRAQSSSPPIPKWGAKRSEEENIKAQIKFWARAVASNVRQEC